MNWMKLFEATADGFILSKDARMKADIFWKGYSNANKFGLRKKI